MNQLTKYSIYLLSIILSLIIHFYLFNQNKPVIKNTGAISVEKFELSSNNIIKPQPDANKSENKSENKQTVKPTHTEPIKKNDSASEEISVNQNKTVKHISKVVQEKLKQPNEEKKQEEHTTTKKTVVEPADINQKTNYNSQLLFNKNTIEISNLENIQKTMNYKKMAFVFFEYNGSGDKKKKYSILDSNNKLIELSKEELKKQYSNNLIRISNLNFKIELLQSVNLQPLQYSVAICLSKLAVDRILTVIKANGHSIEKMENTIIRLEATETDSLFKLKEVLKYSANKEE